jgi:hypothetical protein
LHNAFRDEISMFLFFSGMLEKLVSDGLGVDSFCHVVMALVTQDANDFSGQGFIEHAQNDFAITLVRVGYGAILNMLTGSPADFGNVAEERTFVLIVLAAVFVAHVVLASCSFSRTKIEFSLVNSAIRGAEKQSASNCIQQPRNANSGFRAS